MSSSIGIGRPRCWSNERVQGRGLAASNMAVVDEPGVRL